MVREYSAVRHIQLYRILSVLCGTGLAIGSLLLCAYAIASHVQLAPLGLVLGPICGLAGVFVWGYRPRQTENASVIKSRMRGTEFGQTRSTADSQGEAEHGLPRLSRDLRA